MNVSWCIRWLSVTNCYYLVLLFFRLGDSILFTSICLLFSSPGLEGTYRLVMDLEFQNYCFAFMTMLCSDLVKQLSLGSDLTGQLMLCSDLVKQLSLGSDMAKQMSFCCFVRSLEIMVGTLLSYCFIVTADL